MRCSGTWRLLADPLCSLLTVGIILVGVTPLLKQSANILLNKVPRQ